MRIETITIDSFGALSDYTLAFGEGVNVVEGPNESGKSTISAFIKFMLYGVSGKAGDGSVSERNRAVNWSGSVAKGSMTLWYEKKRYRIERTLHVYTEGARQSVRETVNIVDLATNTPCFKGQVPGEAFLGVSEKVFVNTAYFRQLSDTGIDAAEMNSAIENMLFSADESINIQKALDKLDGARRTLFYKNGKGGAIYEDKLRLEKLKAQHDQAKRTNEEIFATEGLLAEKNQRAQERKATIAELRRKNDAYELYTTLRQFDELHRQKAAVAALEAEYARLRAEKGHDGFLPDGAYVDTLRRLGHGLASASYEISGRENELARLQYESGELTKNLEVLNEADARGGPGEVLQNCEKAAISARSYQMFGFVLLFLGAIAGAGGYVLSLLLTSILAKVLPAVIFALFAAGAVTLFSLAGRQKRQAKALAAAFGAADVRALRSLFEKCEADKQKLEAFLASLASVQKEMDKLKGQYERHRAELDEALAKMGIRLESHTPEALAPVVDRCEAISRDADRILRKYETEKAVMTATAERLARFDEEKIRAGLAGFDLAELEKINITELRRELKLHESQMESIELKIRDLSRKLGELNAATPDPAHLKAEIDELVRKIERDTLRHDAYVLASEAIVNSGESLRRRIAPRLTEYACEMMSAMTGGKYDTLGVSGQLEMTFEGGGGTRSLDYLSAGTRDLAYIGLRLALIDLFFGEHCPPLMFDESFSHQDNERAARLLKVLHLLADQGQQSFIFTCHEREGKLAARLGDVKLVKLAQN